MRHGLWSCSFIPVLGHKVGSGFGVFDSGSLPATVSAAVFVSLPNRVTDARGQRVEACSLSFVFLCSGSGPVAQVVRAHA